METRLVLFPSILSATRLHSLQLYFLPSFLIYTEKRWKKEENFKFLRRKNAFKLKGFIFWYLKEYKEVNYGWNEKNLNFQFLLEGFFNRCFQYFKGSFTFVFILYSDVLCWQHWFNNCVLKKMSAISQNENDWNKK